VTRYEFGNERSGVELFGGDLRMKRWGLWEEVLLVLVLERSDPAALVGISL
jgi:hypothetical protein